ncbi:MAG: ArnT family glycosyltransferase [Candidatus Aquicultorales bacterium]
MSTTLDNKSNYRLMLVVAIILLVAAGLRFGYVTFQDSLEIKAVHGDTYVYEMLANNLVDGNGYVVNGLLNRPAVSPTAFYGPSYPLFLSASYLLFGAERLPVQVLQILLSVATVFLVYLTGKELFGRTAGLTAAALTAVYPDLVGYAGALLSETLYLFLEMLLVFILVRAFKDEKPGWRVLVLAGLVFGAAYLTRQAIALVPIALLPVAYVKYGKHGAAYLAVSLAAFAMGAALLIGPWTVRNYIVFDRLYPGTTTGSVTFWWGNKGDWESDMAVHVEVVKRSHPTYGEMQLDALFYRLGLEDLRSLGPVGTAKLLVRKMFQMWRPNHYFAKSMSSPLLLAQMAFIYGLLATGSIGMVLAARRSSAVWVIAVVFFTGLGINLMSLAIKRYTLPFLPLLFIAAPPLWIAWWKRFRGRC